MGSSKAPEIKETEAEKAFAEVAAKQWQDYQDYYAPLEDQFMGRVNSMGTDNYQGRAVGLSQANAMQGVGAAQAGLERQQFNQGVNPNSGGFKTKSMVLNTAINNSKTAAGIQGQFGAQNQYLTGLANVNALGAGQQTMAMQGMSQMAGQAAQQAGIDAQNKFSDQQSRANMIGGIAGGVTAAGVHHFTPAPQTGLPPVAKGAPQMSPVSHQQNFMGLSGYGGN